MNIKTVSLPSFAAAPPSHRTTATIDTEASWIIRNASEPERKNCMYLFSLVFNRCALESERMCNTNSRSKCEQCIYDAIRFDLPNCITHTPDARRIGFTVMLGIFFVQFRLRSGHTTKRWNDEQGRANKVWMPLVLCQALSAVRSANNIFIDRNSICARRR